jgi:O-antigen ligase
MVSLRPSLPPGGYQLVWGMLQHNILWFRHRNIPEAHTAVHIDEGTAFVPAPLETIASIPGGEMPTLPPTVERFELWRAAVRMWAERPLLGVGPDNFRHRYGRYLDLPDWDRRLHANNLYLELLAGWGLAGTLAFAGLMLVVAHRWLRLWRRATGMVAIWTVALGGSFLAFFIHGLLDYFLEFVPLYLLFWIVAALIVAMERIARKSTH